MRLFTGIDIPDDVAGQLSGLLDRLRPTAHLKWTAPYNFHLTTKFIGQWKEERLPELVEKLKPLGKRPALAIRLEGIGWFPNPHNPRILWTGVKAGPELGKAGGRHRCDTRRTRHRERYKAVLSALDTGSHQRACAVESPATVNC